MGSYNYKGKVKIKFKVTLANGFQPFSGTCYLQAQGTLKMASDRRLLQMLVTIYQTTSRHIPEESNLHSYWRESLKCLIRVKSPMCIFRHHTI
jgi:hypothetical protein